MANEKLSFNKRISMVKKEVFEGVTTSGKLDEIKNSSSGYYTITTIEGFLHPALDRYNLDFDMEVTPTEIVGLWIDCEGDSEKTRKTTVNFSRIENAEKMQGMANIIMNEGGILSYTRRYALATILRLPATDTIEKIVPTDLSDKQKEFKAICMELANGNEEKALEILKDRTKFKKGNETVPGAEAWHKLSDGRIGANINKVKNELKAKKKKAEEAKKDTMTQDDIKRFFAIMKEKEIESKEADELIKKAFKVKSKKDITRTQFLKLVDVLKRSTKEQIIERMGK